MADLTDVIIDGDPYDEDENGGWFVGATALTDGEQGDVPKPLAGQQNATLFGDGKWKTLLYDALARYENPSNGRSNTYTGDLNDITQNCIVNTDGNNANLPSGITNWGFVITLVHSNQATYASQIYMTMNIDGTKRSVWFRDKDNGTWRDWKTFATASSLPTSGSSYLAGDETWKSDTANLIATYTTQDDSTTTDFINNTSGETAISTLESGANHARLFNKISRCFLNVRKLINTVKLQWNVMGSTWATGEAVQVNWHRLYNGKWYRCILAHTTSANILPTNTTYWRRVTIDSEITNIQNNMESLNDFAYDRGFGTADGRYYTRKISQINVDGRFAFLVLRASQSKGFSPIGATVNNYKGQLHGIMFSDTSITFDINTMTITADNGYSAWASPTILYPRDSITFE